MAISHTQNTQFKADCKLRKKNYLENSYCPFISCLVNARKAALRQTIYSMVKTICST